MEKIVACEISFIPIQSINYKLDVDEVLKIISKSGVQHKVGLMSTTITGKKDEIFTLIKNIYSRMEDKTMFSMNLKLSNECGCKY